MSTSTQIPKVNYAKARMKSKTKNQAESQQKIVFEGESSTDIFAHLNQDNLNYIKKQLKNKKTSQNHHQRARSSNIVQTVSLKNQHIKSPEQDQTIQQIKMYKKYKNQNQVIQRDSRQEDTMRETSVDGEVDSGGQIQNQKNFHSKIRNNYMGLQPPPAIQKGYKQSLPSTQSQHMKTASFQIHHMDKKRNHEQRNQFFDYQLKSQNSNNPDAKSMMSVQNQNSDNISANLKASQFIDHLQNYIQELNSSPQKQQTRNRRRKSKIVKQSSQIDQTTREIYNFKRNKDFLRNNEGQIARQLDSFGSQNTQSYRPLSNNKTRHGKYTQTNSNYENQRPFLLADTPQNVPENTKQISTEEISKPNKQRIPPSFSFSDSDTQKLKEQLLKERYYCTTLAFELQKYKQKQQQYQTNINVMSKTIGVLKIEVENVRQLYENQMNQTQKIMEFINFYKQNNNKTKKAFRQNSDISQTNQRRHYLWQKQKRQSYKGSQKLNLHTNLYPRRNSQSAEDFQQIMRFKYSEPVYNKLDSLFLDRLNDNFQKGQSSYRQAQQSDRKNPLLESKKIQNYINYKKSKQNNYNKAFSKEGLVRNTSYQIQNADQNPYAGKYSVRNKKQKSSLEKLKEQYGNFKAQAHVYRPEKTHENKQIKYQLSPEQFSRIFVK